MLSKYISCRDVESTIEAVRSGVSYQELVASPPSVLPRPAVAAQVAVEERSSLCWAFIKYIAFGDRAKVKSVSN